MQQSEAACERRCCVVLVSPVRWTTKSPGSSQTCFETDKKHSTKRKQARFELELSQRISPKHHHGQTQPLGKFLGKIRRSDPATTTTPPRTATDAPGAYGLQHSGHPSLAAGLPAAVRPLVRQIGHAGVHVPELHVVPPAHKPQPGAPCGVEHLRAPHGADRSTRDRAQRQGKNWVVSSVFHTG